MTALDADRIRRACSAAARLERFEAFAEVDSTNTFLKNTPPPARGNIHVAIAAHQTAGRGRRERQWVSAPGNSLCLSMSYAFQRRPENLPAVTLAIGVGIARALQSIGVEAIGLKWPNDVMAGGRKLGGILTETQFGGADDIDVVTGIGLNVGRVDSIAVGSDAADAHADWAPAAVGLASLLRETPDREQLASLLINAMFDTFVAYDESGVEHFRADFAALDWLADKQVMVEAPGGRIAGIAKGINTVGALLVESDSGVQTIMSGSILSAAPLTTQSAAPA